MMKATIHMQGNLEFGTPDQYWDIDCPFMENESDQELLDEFKKDMEKVYGEMTLGVVELIYETK